MLRFSPRRRLTRLRVPGVTTAPEAVRRDSHPTGPNQLWLADAAVANTVGGRLYVAAVLDCYSRRCLGSWIDRRLGPGLIIRAIQQAVHRQSSLEDPLGRPAPQGDVTLALTSRCESAGVAVPPGASPSAIDGAVAESFFSALRSDLADAPIWATRTDAAEAVADWIESSYNARRAAPLPSHVA